VMCDQTGKQVIQGEPTIYGINPVKDGVLKFKNPDGTGKE